MNYLACRNEHRATHDGPGAAPSAAVFARCGRCAASFGAAAWSDLALVVRLDDESLSGIVVGSLGASIQVRVCARCGGRIARKVRGA